MKRGQLQIDCPRCKGEGRVSFTGVIADTGLLLLASQPREVTAKELAEASGVRLTAMINRLRRLEQLGLAESRGYGRQIFWKAARADGKRRRDGVGETL